MKCENIQTLKDVFMMLLVSLAARVCHSTLTSLVELKVRHILTELNVFMMIKWSLVGFSWSWKGPVQHMAVTD